MLIIFYLIIFYFILLLINYYYFSQNKYCTFIRLYCVLCPLHYISENELWLLSDCLIQQQMKEWQQIWHLSVYESLYIFVVLFWKLWKNYCYLSKWDHKNYICCCLPFTTIEVGPDMTSASEKQMKKRKHEKSWFVFAVISKLVLSYFDKCIVCHEPP